MSKALFINGNVHGHINPTLPLVSELVKRGEEIHYFSTMEFKQKIEATGAKFIDYGQSLYNFLNNYRPSGNHPFYTLIEFVLKMDEVAVNLVLEKIGSLQYDYVIHDSMLGGGSFIAKKLNLPAICSCTSFAMNKLPMPPNKLERGSHPQLDNYLDEADRMSNDLNIEMPSIMNVFFKKEPLNIVFTSRLFQPQADSFDNSYKFIGPSIADRKEDVDFEMDQLKNKKVLYISMGTINNNLIEFYRKCIDAFKDKEFTVIMSVGNKLDIGAIGEFPGNFIIKNYVPQLEVLKRTDLFISHGGLNSVSEALYYGVPIISIPQANDQHMVTRQLIDIGAGIGLKMDEITPEVLYDTANKMLKDNSYKDACEKVRLSFIEAGGYKSGADYIMGRT